MGPSPLPLPPPAPPVVTPSLRSLPAPGDTCARSSHGERPIPSRLFRRRDRNRALCPGRLLPLSPKARPWHLVPSHNMGARLAPASLEVQSARTSLLLDLLQEQLKSVIAYLS